MTKLQAVRANDRAGNELRAANLIRLKSFRLTIEDLGRRGRHPELMVLPRRQRRTIHQQKCRFIRTDAHKRNERRVDETHFRHERRDGGAAGNAPVR